MSTSTTQNMIDGQLMEDPIVPSVLGRDDSLSAACSGGAVGYPATALAETQRGRREAYRPRLEDLI